MDVVRLRFEAVQCHLAATRSFDLAEQDRLYIQGLAFSALADQLQRQADGRVSAFRASDLQHRFGSSG